MVGRHAPASSALPKPIEGALDRGAVVARLAGAAGENAVAQPGWESPSVVPLKGIPLPPNMPPLPPALLPKPPGAGPKVQEAVLRSKRSGRSAMVAEACEERKPKPSPVSRPSRQESGTRTTDGAFFPEVAARAAAQEARSWSATSASTSRATRARRVRHKKVIRKASAAHKHSGAMHVR